MSATLHALDKLFTKALIVQEVFLLFPPFIAETINIFKSKWLKRFLTLDVNRVKVTAGSNILVKALHRIYIEFYLPLLSSSCFSSW